MTTQDQNEGRVNESQDGRVAILEIVRPPTNYFNAHIIGLLADAVSRLSDDAECRAIVLCSSGRHFCTGADFGGAEFADDKVAAAGAIYRRGSSLFAGTKPIIAAMQGAAVGGGLGLALVADFRVASTDARLAANFARLGFHQGFGLSVTLPRVVGTQTAADLLLSGRSVPAPEAHKIGLVDRVVAPGHERTAAVAWAKELAQSAPLAVTSIRATLRGDLAGQVGQALEHELAEQDRLWATDDCAEGIAASRERREPEFTGR